MREDLHNTKGATGDSGPDGVDFDPPPRPRRFPAELALRWTPIRPNPGEALPLHVLIEQSALHQMRQHVRQAVPGAVGLLTGDLNRCPESGELWLSIEQASPGRGSATDDADTNSLDGVVSPLIREQALQGKRAIGWYHVHSSLGVFLAPGEAEFHQMRFPEIWQVAIVLLDAPERPAAGIFLRSADGVLSRSGYVAFFERLHHSSLLPEGRKRSFIGWSNHATEEPVVLAGSDGIPDDLSDHPPSPAPETAAPPDSTGTTGSATGERSPAGERTESESPRFKGVTPVAAGPEVETGASEEAHDRAQMKRALSAVDFSITSPAEPLAASSGTLPGRSADPRSVEREQPPRPQPQAGDEGTSSANARDGKTLPWERWERASDPATPVTTRGPESSVPVEPIGSSVWQQYGSRSARRTRLGRIVWSALGLGLVGLLAWLVLEGGRSSVSGEPALEEAVPPAVDRPVSSDGPPASSDSESGSLAVTSDLEPGLTVAPSEVESSVEAAETPSTGDPPEVELTPEIVPPPPEVQIAEPFASDRPGARQRIDALDPLPEGERENASIDSETSALRAGFLAALEVFGQESAGYQERRDAYARGLVGCNALNSWYRSVGDAFVRLSSKVVEAGPGRASIWREAYEDARARMDEIDRHYLASECPLPP